MRKPEIIFLCLSPEGGDGQMIDPIQSSIVILINPSTLVLFQVFTEESVQVLLVHLLQVQHILVLLNQLRHGWRVLILI
jgi:hypothetical protein